MTIEGQASRRRTVLARVFQEGAVLHRRGKLEEAAQHYRRVLEGEPRHFDALHLLGVIAAQQGRLDEAVDLLTNAVKERPSAAEAHNNLGMALNLAKRHEAAIPVLEKAIAINPKYATAYNNLGTAHQALDRWEQAARCFKRALTFKPDYIEALSNLGGALHSVKRDEEAIKVLNKALTLNPQFPEAHGNLGVALMMRDRWAEAMASSARAVSLDPGNAIVHAQMGAAHLTMGRLEDARRSFETAVKLEPANPNYYLKLVGCYTVDTSDPYFQAMEDLARRIDILPGDGPIELHFALAKAYADIGQDERSFRHLLEGNALKRRTITYDEAATLALFDRIRTSLSGDVLQQKSGLGDPSAVPIFILGMMRSGSTLVEQVLASHPSVFAAGERPYFTEAYNGVRRAINSPLAYPEFVPTLDGSHLRQIGEAYVNHLRATPSARPDARITDKMPGNFAAVGLIHLALPNARIIHTWRNPVDTCLSAFSKLFSDHQPFTYDLGELGRYYRAYSRLMEHWRRFLPDGVMLDVQYETLVEDFEPQARRIIAHCGLEWDDACLSFYETRRPVRTASAAQVRQPIYRSSIDRWRPEQDILRPLIQGLGAEPESGNASAEE